MKKERIFYLDFIRAIAVIAILLTHYNALFLYAGDNSALKNIVITYKVANIYIGGFGVSLFLIISGASLMYVYKDKLDLKKFYYKRFMNIYPMFWIAFVFAFLYTFYKDRCIDRSVPRINILFSVFGMDGYLQTAFKTYYKLGEWFLGFIIIMYVIFPLLRLAVLKAPAISFSVSLVVACLSIRFYDLPIPDSTFLLVRLPEILFGMIFITYVKKCKASWAVVSLIVIVINTIVKPDFNHCYQNMYIGIAFFVLFAYISQFLKDLKLLTAFCKVLCKYSYAIFLTHHIIMYRISYGFDLIGMTSLESYLLFVWCCIVIAIFTKLLYDLNDKVVAGVENYLRTRKDEKAKGE